MISYRFPHVTVEIDDDTRTVTSLWPEDVRLAAKPNYDEESLQRAKSLGYWKFGAYKHYKEEESSAIWQMTRQHDLFHHLVAMSQGDPYSLHLRCVAEGKPSDGHNEECLVLLMQRLANAGIDDILKAMVTSATMG